MENTIKNMDLALSKVEKEFGLFNFQEIKTLTNTYTTLFRQVKDKIPNSIEKIPHKNELTLQLEKVVILCDGVDEKIYKELEKESYKNADNLSVSLERLKKIQRDLQWILAAEFRYESAEIRSKDLPRHMKNKRS